LVLTAAPVKSFAAFARMQKTNVSKSVRPVSSRWMPELWASPAQLGVSEQHSNPFLEVFRAFWENWDHLPVSVDPAAAANLELALAKSEPVLRP
jgi:hypothetical protein